VCSYSLLLTAKSVNFVVASDSYFCVEEIVIVQKGDVLDLYCYVMG